MATTYWLRIERQHTPGDLVVGPYPDMEAATHAMDHALLIDGFCEEDALECYVSIEPPGRENDEAVLIDPTDPHHTGRSE